MKSFRVLAEMDFSNLRHNLDLVRRAAPGARILAMVKGNAYGHGMVTVAKHLRDVDYFGVVGIQAAIALRHSGVIQPIVLLDGFYSKEELALIFEYHLDVSIFNLDQIDLIKNYDPLNKTIRVWIKIDTGMHRLGLGMREIPEAYSALKSCPAIGDIYFMTHFSDADKPDSPSVKIQLGKFLKLIGDYKNLKSAANSGALLQYPETQLDIVRPGLILYGASPCKNKTAQDLGLKPVMTLKSKIVSLHSLEIGERVGYGSTWRALRKTRIAVISIGYGDGYPQSAAEGTPVLIKGRRAFLAGRVSMYSMTVDVTDIPEVLLGEEVVLWGEGLPIEEVAVAMGASPYALLTGVTSRVSIELKELI